MALCEPNLFNVVESRLLLLDLSGFLLLVKELDLIAVPGVLPAILLHLEPFEPIRLILEPTLPLDLMRGREAGDELFGLESEPVSTP